MLIKEVKARAIRCSNNDRTIEVSVNGVNGAKGRASAPSGESKGKYETKSYHKSLSWNVDAINNLKELKGVEISKFDDLIKVEKLIRKKYKLKNAREFGANALYALESAILKALAKSQKKQLWQVVGGFSKARKMPIPLGNAVGGGLHSHIKNKPVFQEFLIIPKAKTFKNKVKIMNEVYAKVGKMLKAKTKDDEGAWQSNMDEEKILQLLAKLSKSYRFNTGMDIAASTFYKNGKYIYNDKILSKDEQKDYVSELISKYNLFYVEDPFQEEDFSGFSSIRKDKNNRKNKNNLVAGDDLTATQLIRLKKAVKRKSINAVIIKPNQNGSLLELRAIFDFCRKHKLKTIISHRSGETLDNAIADYAFAFQADFVKFGIYGKVREVKLKRMADIEKTVLSVK